MYGVIVCTGADDFHEPCRKGVSFLSRFIGTKKKDQVSESNDNASEAQDEGANGMEIFAQPIGFIPRFPPPPKYIKVKAHYKKQKTFDRVFLAQELRGVGDTAEGEDDSKALNKKAIWALVFSKDGKYLAAAGQDKVVRVWAVITNAEDREAHEQEEDEATADDEEGVRLTAPVFKSKPIREYKGHTGSVLDLSWSKVRAVDLEFYVIMLTVTEQLPSVNVYGSNGAPVARQQSRVSMLFQTQ